MLGVSIALCAGRVCAREPRERDEPPRLLGVQELGVTLGAVDYTESNVVLLSYPGGSVAADPFHTRGEWLALQSQYDFTSWFAVATRARVGWERRAPASVPDPTETVDGGDPSTLDPQLGDSRVGGSVAAMVRFLPGHTAIDAGVTVSFASFRPRYEGAGVTYAQQCGDCDDGKLGFVALPIWPTLRVSRTGTGFAWAVATGEGFIRTNEPTPFELLVGKRWDNAEVLGGISRGVAIRLDGRIAGNYWLSADVSTKPWGADVEGARGFHRWIASLTLTHRWSSFSPL